MLSMRAVSLIRKCPLTAFTRKGKIYTDDNTGEVLGVEAIDIGTAKITQTEGDIAKMSILRSTREVLGEDRFAAKRRARYRRHFLSQLEKNAQGKVIDVAGGVQEYGAMNVVLIDKGKRDNLEVGNVLAIFAQGETMKDPVTGETIKLINERAGLLMVFNVFEKTSYALVLESTAH